MWKNIVTFLSLVLISTSIYIPFSGTQRRCMIIYSVGESETVKLDINFPELPEMVQYQFYSLSWTNTETKETNSEKVKPGKYRREINLSPNVIYDLCIDVTSSRDYGIVYVEYSASNVFNVNQAEVKVPENILKSKDVTEAYLNTESIEKVLDSFQIMQENRTKTHAQIFRKTDLISLRLVQISIGQLVLIAVAGGWQFWALWKYLKSHNLL